MEGYIVHGGIEMAPGSLLRIEDASGLRVEVWDGELWITQAGDRRDYLVKPGTSFLLQRNGVALVHALASSRLTLSAPVPAYYARRIAFVLPHGAAPRVVYDCALEAGGWLAGLGHRLARFWIAHAGSNPTTAAV